MADVKLKKCIAIHYRPPLRMSASAAIRVAAGYLQLTIGVPVPGAGVRVQRRL